MALSVKKQKPTAPAPLSLRLSPELHDRLEEAAERTKIKKYNLALLAIEAAVEAIERNNYRIVMPIEFDVTHVPEPAPQPPGKLKRPAA